METRDHVTALVHGGRHPARMLPVSASDPPLHKRYLGNG